MTEARRVTRGGASHTCGAVCEDDEDDDVANCPFGGTVQCKVQEVISRILSRLCVTTRFLFDVKVPSAGLLDMKGLGTPWFLLTPPHGGAGRASGWRLLLSIPVVRS